MNGETIILGGDFDHHEVDYSDKALPWAELVKEV